MSLRSSVITGALLVVVGGCAASSDPVASGPEQSVTAASYYDCFSSFSDDQLHHFEVAIAGSTLEVTDLSKDAVPPDTGALDTSYRPTPAFAGYVRYSGYAAIIAGFSDTSSLDMLASKEIQARAAKGDLAIRSQGPEGGGTSHATCTAKAKKLGVDPARKARLACSLAQLLCTNDDPPGQTCLSDMFLNQTGAAAATLKLTYLDHFGVHAVDRAVALGASKTLARTSDHVDATWADGTGVALALRGGITYTGTYTDRTGATKALQCNDLAMLDP